jgi:plasmid maintenance system antidote protein VapI
VTTARVQLLKDVLPRAGIASIAEFRRRLGLTKQYAWKLWHGHIGLSAAMITRLHHELGLAYETLHQVQRATPPKPRGAKPGRRADGKL